MADHLGTARELQRAIEIVEPNSFIADAAKPLLHIADQLAGPSYTEKKVKKAREYIQKATKLLDEAFTAQR